MEPRRHVQRWGRIVTFSMRRICGLWVTMAAALASPALAAKMAVVPVSAGNPHILIGNEIFLLSGGQRVWLEIRLSGWAPQRLRVWQAKVDSSGYENGGPGALAPAHLTCSGDDDEGDAQCSSAFERGSTCNSPPSGGLFCEAGYQDSLRTDWIFRGLSAGISAVDVHTPDYRYGGTSFPPSSVTDDGTWKYGGTLVLDVPADASGTFVIAPLPFQDSFMFDDTEGGAEVIPLEELIAARITVGEAFFPKGRYLAITPSSEARATGLRVTYPSGLPRPDAPGIGIEPGNRAGVSGFSRWVGPPRDFVERGQPTRYFAAAELQCKPFVTDWSGFDIVQVYGDAVLPGATYAVEEVDQALIVGPDAVGPGTSQGNVHTWMFGDIVPPYYGKTAAIQPDMLDVRAVVDTFLGLRESPIKVRVQLGGFVPNPADEISMLDVVHAIDAFKGLPFPYPIPAECE